MKITKWIVLLITALSLMAAPYQQPKAKSSTADKTATSSKSAKVIDINTASQDELKSLPGIGDAYSAAIIKNRPYANKRRCAQLGGGRPVEAEIFAKSSRIAVFRCLAVRWGEIL